MPPPDDPPADGPPVGTEAIIDASALLAYLRDESGASAVEAALAQGATMSAVNVAEVLSKLVDAGADADEAWARIMSLSIEVADVDASAAIAIARLRHETRGVGLSIADRACLALAGDRHLPAVTADRLWAAVDVGVTVHLIR